MFTESWRSTERKPSETELLQSVLLMTLEEHDGLCLDNQPEREALAAAITTSFMVALRAGAINLVRLLNETPSM